MKDIKLTMSVQEANMLLKALSQFPYHQVHELIAKIQTQANQQLVQANGSKQALEEIKLNGE